ncbi:uncharacterized protein LOC143893308 isoform X3 [Temnothorax americanus]|uniref:uncharacterized protein LOC143893308 isoform X3 n=1 Tax=Temnothorax americanus TaxID=1964332 RepID=UPI004069835C
MSGNDSSATATLTPTSVAVVPAVISVADEEEEEDPAAALTLDCVESGADMDLVNGPNPWLPAYGFQLQHHSQFQPAHLEDLRANDTVLVQQIDFLETILEETSDDLQSDSDRSGTTYWLGSDSETESVIHIKTKQRSADERLDGSGSECNSVVPKKRRRRDHGADHHHHHHHHHQQVTAYDEYPASPRSSRSTASSRSSSLLQFESLERTCATLSPSSYSFDSLEYSNRSNASHPENDSPDSLEQDYDRLLPNGFASTLADHFPRIRPYRSFESLDTCQKDEGFGQASMSNGFAPLYLKRGADLSNIRKNNQRPRDFWHEDEEYEDDDDDDDEEEEDDEYDFEEYERSRTDADSRLTTGFEDRLLFGESGKYATSLDYRNTIDLREIGVETKRDALLELKSGQKTARLNIAGSGAEHHHHHHHHHHHQHPQQQQQQQQQQQYQQQQYDQHDYHHHHHRRQQQHQGWSDEEHFNFRFTDKSQSAPSLLDGVEESARCTSPSRLRTSRTTSYVSTSSLFENYTRVASVPVDLNLCGVAATCDDEMNGHEMAETAPGDEAATLKSSPEEDTILKENDETQVGTKVVLTSSVRTQPAQGALMDGDMKEREKENEERTKVERASDRCETRNKQTKTTSTVKTQDRSNCVLDIAMVTENDLDEAIKQFKREVEEAAASGVANAAILAMETIQRTASGRVKSRKVKNNASYELAQQLEVDEKNFQKKLKDNDEERDGASSPGKKRVLNNASYELAQQCDYIKALQSSRAAFQRIDACDELEEAASGRSSKLNVADVMRQMGSDTNVSEDSKPKEPQNDSFFGQIKKNSDPFSACGDASTLNPRLLDDEVDYPCLETKPIGASCLENRVVLRENIESEKSTPLKSVLENSSTVSSYVDEESLIKRSEEETGDAKKTFIGEFYPERAAQLPRKSPEADESGVQERKMNSENASSDRDHEDHSRSPGSNDRGAGECLWRVVIEKQAVTKKEEEKEEEKRDRMEAVEKKEVEEEGHSVRGVGSESPPGGTGSLGERSSGKPAVVVAAVDTNHRGGDRDKRQGDEQQRAPSINNPDASVANAKRSSSFVAPKREPARTYAVSSTSLPSSSSSAAMKSEERKKGGLGGFLQRFSRLRFSGRTKVPRSEAHKKAVEPTTRTQEEQQLATAKKKEPDYIIIPLHPPEEERRRQQEVVTLEEAARRNNVDIQRSASSVSSNGRAPVSSKPPLPPQPPRVAALGMSTRASASASASRRRAATDLGNPAAIEMAKARAMQAAQERPVGLLETDLDEAVISTSYNGTTYTAGPTAVSAAAAATAAAAAAAAAAAGAGGKKTRSLLDLNHTSAAAPRPRPEHALHVPQSPVGATHRSPRDDVASAATSAIHQRPHKSMEFLLDKENLHFVKPPENELQKVGERVPSEHELRVQRSLQRLNVPDWYKNSPAARDGFRLKRHSDASQHGGWRALGSKTTSLSSLSSSSNRQPTTGVLLSPSPTPPVFSRWSTSLLNSAGSSPASSARSSFNHRQPYLGWRSQERLTNPRTPAERLAQGILPQLQAANKQQQQQQQQTTNQQLEVRNSIKEVTSAIVHYVQSGQEVGGGGGGRLSPRSRPEDWDDRGGARSTSPRGSVRLCWMESSFVGTRPVDSPETPMSLATDQEAGDCCNAAGTESCSCQDSAASGLYLDLTPSRDDLRHQHLQTSSAGPSPTSSSNYHHHRHHQHRQHRQQQQQHQQQRHHRESAKSVMDVHQATVDDQRNFYPGELVRRKSEGSDTLPASRAVAASSSSLMPRGSGGGGGGGGGGGSVQPRHRRVSFDNAQDSTTNGSSAMDKVVRCRNNKCGNSTTLAEARRTYKSCHNCTCLYCSRECRRAHWQRHRRTCLHSRAGSLCRQVLSSAKEDPATLKHISALARRGYAAHGRGAVKCFFSSPEAAERFVGNGFADLGEPTYVRWSDLLPGEMGAELYAELMRLCKTYNPEARLVLYVAVCVVSEVPTSGAVRWERQLVSRCAKIRLDGAAKQHASSSSASPQARRRLSQQLAPASPCNITREMDSPETLVLTSLPGNNGQNTPRKAREISFTNIQRQLRLRGVSLRRHFPQVYRKLCSYVDGSVDKFAPVTIYPRDQASGKSFMCIIMLDAEPERLQLLPTDSSRVRTVDISVEQE